MNKICRSSLPSWKRIVQSWIRSARHLQMRLLRWVLREPCCRYIILMKRERAQLQVDQQGVSTDALLKTMPGTPNWLKAKPATQSPFSVLNQKQVQNDNPFAGTGAVSEIFHESETLASPQLKENNAPNYQSPQKSVKSLSFASPASSLFKKAENLVQKRAHRTPFRLALDSENTPQRNRMMATSTPNFDDE